MSTSSAAEWIPIPAWKAFPWLRGGFSTRQGGVSPAYGSHELNLGWTPDDPPENVAQNRKLLLDAVTENGSQDPLVTLRQVHGESVLDLDSPIEGDKPLSAAPRALMTPDGRALHEADGLTTRTPGIWLGVITADCVPVLLTDVRLRAVGGFHAGWRGTVAGIVREGVRKMTDNYGSRPEDLRAAIGPCLRTCCFEVGAEVVEQFREAFGGRSEALLFTGTNGRPRIDLQAANRIWLQDAGLPADAIVTVSECSACSRTPEGRRRFFSHRAEKGVTGRMLSVISVRPEG